MIKLCSIDSFNHFYVLFYSLKSTKINFYRGYQDVVTINEIKKKKK